MQRREQTLAETADAEILHDFDVESCHSIRVAAPANLVYGIATQLDLSSSPLVRFLFALRCIPSSGLKREGLVRMNFKVLQEVPNRDFVVGLIGRFWTLRGELLDFEPEEFANFDKPGYAKATWSFHCSETSGETILTTTTRVRCLDPVSRRRFKRYWSVIGPFSGLIRREALRIVKQKAERLAKSN